MFPGVAVRNTRDTEDSVGRLASSPVWRVEDADWVPFLIKCFESFCKSFFTLTKSGLQRGKKKEA